ncbi:MAG: HAMP domain-containing histidine kinase [Candidatus Levybacteria bacterium]|nr:HAMP domain-containing histidine kinase [Candidatus Levybacteria bacterium]
MTKIDSFFEESLFLFLGMGLFLALFAATFHKGIIAYIHKHHLQLRDVRLLLFALFLLIVVTITYLVIDTYVFPLPEPVVPYIFYMLAFTAFFGLRLGLVACAFSLILLEYYLHGVERDFNLLHHPLNILALFTSVIVGSFWHERIYTYQKRLSKRAKYFRHFMRLREQFEAMAVHELRAPLTTIRLYADAVNQRYGEDANSTLGKSMQMIHTETEKLAIMVNDLLDFSRFRKAKFSLHLEVFDLGKLCEERLAVIQSFYPNHSYLFSKRVKSAVIRADKMAIDRVLTNLLINAGKYSTPKGKITLILEKQHKNYLLSVKDEGEGIAKRDWQMIFRPFFQTKRGGQGLGLGLYIAKSIIQLHKGRIWVESKKGKGATFFVQLTQAFEKN